MSVVVDGRAKFGTSIQEFYRRPEIARMLERRRLLALPTEIAEDAPPALARLEPYQGRAKWHALCPDCRGSEYVWLDDPRFLCANCANASIGYRWRRVELPPNRRQIERLLEARPDPDTRGWAPGETVEQLMADNVMLLGGGG